MWSDHVVTEQRSFDKEYTVEKSDNKRMTVDRYVRIDRQTDRYLFSTVSASCKSIRRLSIPADPGPDPLPPTPVDDVYACRSLFFSWR